ncbi:MAG: glycosyltransferase family 4 protein [Planctomycetes bacterium]|nr:glycosyltransferase family 4 protein [Planctomycetota bacterium]
MRIWIVNQYAIPPSVPGGTRHFQFARRLIERGHEVLLVAQSVQHFTTSEIADTGSQLYLRQEVEGVPFLWVKTPPYQGNGLGRIRNMLQFGRRVRRGAASWGIARPDVILGSTPAPTAALAARRLARRWGIPFALEIRDLWPQTFLDIGTFRTWHPAMVVLARLERSLYQAADHIFTLLPASFEHIRARGGGDKITWLPNGVALDTLPDIGPPEEGGSFRLIYAGAHNLANSLDTFLLAASSLVRRGEAGKVELHFYGEGHAKADLLRQRDAAGLDFVHFHPAVPKTDIYQVLATADAFLIAEHDSPLYRHGTSRNKMFDYLAMKRPVISATSSVSDPVMESGGGISVPAERPEAVADAILELVGLTAETRQKMGALGRCWVEEVHDFELLTDRLESRLQAMVE